MCINMYIHICVVLQRLENPESETSISRYHRASRFRKKTRKTCHAYHSKTWWFHKSPGDGQDSVRMQHLYSRQKSCVVRVSGHIASRSVSWTSNVHILWQAPKEGITVEITGCLTSSSSKSSGSSAELKKYLPSGYDKPSPLLVNKRL